MAAFDPKRTFGPDDCCHAKQKCKAKTQTYCEARDIAKQIVRAGQQTDNEKLQGLADKLTEQETNLGSEYLALMESLRGANLTSKDGQEIESLFDTLDESCPH